MKDIFGLVLVMLGASIFGSGFKMLSPELQSKFAKDMQEKISGFLSRKTKSATHVDVNKTIL